MKNKVLENFQTEKKAKAEVRWTKLHLRKVSKFSWVRFSHNQSIGLLACRSNKLHHLINYV